MLYLKTSLFKFYGTLIFLLLVIPGFSFSQKPSPRWAHQMVYDTQHKNILLFGGAAEGKWFGDLWSWNGFAWSKLSDKQSMARDAHIFVYDEWGNVAVVFGGRRNDSLLGDIWEWNGKNWDEINVNGPEARVHAVASFDKKTKLLFLFGGICSGNRFMRDTWCYNGRQWKLIDTTGPSKCAANGMIYDESAQVLRMITSNIDSLGTTQSWYWNGSSWKLDSISPPLIKPIQATASTENQLILFDGNGDERNNSIIWIYHDNQWQQLKINTPSKRMGYAMTYDKDRKRILLFGGGLEGKLFFNDTWEWDGEQWIQKK